MDYRSSRTLRGVAELVGALLILAAVTFLLREELYRMVSEWTADSGFWSRVSVFITDPGLVLLVLIAAGLAVWGWFRDRNVLVRLACAGVGVIAAYTVSELVKSLVRQERPCRTYDVVTVLVCREPGNWSWPSNHTTIAAAFAAACIVAVPTWRKLAVTVMTLAGLVGVSRVAVGMHYFHDVFAGLALGIAVVTVVSVFLIPFVVRRTANLRWLWGPEAIDDHRVAAVGAGQPGMSASPEEAGDLLSQGTVSVPGRR